MRLFFALLLLIAVPAQAEQLTLETACKEISKQNNTETEGAEYKPGVDVNGNPVAPADIEAEAGTEIINYPLEVPVEIDAIKFVDSMAMQALRDAGADLETNIVNVLLHEDGRVKLNGTDITEDINIKCVEMTDIQPVILEKNPEYEEDKTAEEEVEIEEVDNEQTQEQEAETEQNQPEDIKKDE